MPSMWRASDGERMRRVMKRMPRASRSASTSWVVTRWSSTRVVGSVPGRLAPVVAEGEDLAGLGGLGDVGVGVDEVVGAGVLGEERQHAAGALGTPWHVVLFQRGVFAPVHDGVEVQVEVAALGEAGGEHLAVERGEEAALAFVGEPVAVGGQRGRLGQRGQPGEQPGAGVGGEVVDMGDAADAGELERQQRQHR